MTCLSVVQDIMREVGFPPPSVVINNNNHDVRQCLSAVQRTIEELTRKKWTCLVKEHTFETTANIPDYAFPQDFGSMVADSTYNRGQAWPSYPLSTQNWQTMKSGITESVAYDAWRMKVKQGVNRFYIDPTPAGVATFAFEYRSKYPVRDASDAQTFRSVYANDGDVCLIDEYLITLGGIWRFLKRQGEAYGEEKLEYQTQVDIAFAQDGGSRTICMTNRSVGIAANTGQTGFNGYEN